MKVRVTGQDQGLLHREASVSRSQRSSLQNICHPQHGSNELVRTLRSWYKSVTCMASLFCFEDRFSLCSPGTHYASQAGLKLASILPPLFHEYWDYRHTCHSWLCYLTVYVASQRSKGQMDFSEEVDVAGK